MGNNTATLRLFNAIQVENSQKKHFISKDILERTLRNGYILAPNIDPSDDLLDQIESVVGISGEKANNAFHKSWKTIKDTPQEALWLQAAIHYFTTYGFEALGCFNESTVYFPQEQLDVPEVTENIPLTVVGGMDRDELLEKIIVLSSGVALAQETLNDIFSIISSNDYSSEFVNRIKNRELKATLFDYYGLVPTEPVEFLRHLISKLTDESLVIKNKYLIEKIKASNGKFLDELLQKAPDDLASIFFRYKPLFLAMKSISKNKTFFNQLRKKANKLHKPLQGDYLNDVTANLKRKNLSIEKLEKKLENASIFRKVRLANALRFREDASRGANESIVYRIRNGRGWATEFNWPDSLITGTQIALDSVLTSIANDIRENVDEKIIYIPRGIGYAMPATEKQFTGFLPTGSYVSVPESLIIGIHWFNVKGYRVDLDLSTLSLEGKIGWDSNYKTSGGDVLFSGDVTQPNPKKGASELFYFKKDIDKTSLLMVNYYNFSAEHNVDTKVLVAHETPGNFDNNYMVNTNNIIASANININQKQNVLGLITNVDGGNRFYFANINLGNRISGRNNEQTTHAREYLKSSLVSSVKLDEVLALAGANIVTEKPEDKEFIDLSPELLDKTTIIDLIQKEEKE